MMEALDPAALWHGLGWPLIRLMFFISLGLAVGNLIEGLNWTRHVARVAEPLVRLGRLKDVSGASFSLAFFSGVAANSMLSEAHDKGEITDRELLLSNLFNSLPTYFLHLPTIFFITAPFLGSAAFLYVGLTLGAAFLRTGFIVVLGRVLLPPLPEGCVVCILEDQEERGWKQALETMKKRFKKRLPKIVRFTIPIFTAMYFLKAYGFFTWLQNALADKVDFFSWLSPQALGIVVFHVGAEFTAGLAAAGALMQDGELVAREVVLALLLGNVLSTPMRAMRHQFPYYAGIFKPRMALRLIVVNQGLRALSVIVVGTCYYFWS